MKIGPVEKGYPKDTLKVALQTIESLEIGETVFISASRLEIKSIRSALWDPSRTGGHSGGFYKTKATLEGIRIWRVGEGRY